MKSLLIFTNEGSVHAWTYENRFLVKGINYYVDKAGNIFAWDKTKKKGLIHFYGNEFIQLEDAKIAFPYKKKAAKKVEEEPIRLEDLVEEEENPWDFILE